MADRVQTDPKGNQRDRVLSVLVSRSNPKGYVRDVDVPLIARMTGIDEHDVAKQLWGMQKQGVIGFSTRHIKGKTVPYRFRITRKARNTDDGDTALLGDRASHAVTNPTKRVHGVGPDLLDPRTAARRQHELAGPVTTTPGHAVIARDPHPEEAILLDAISEPTERPSEALEPVPGIQARPVIEEPKEPVPSPRALDDYPEIAAILARRDRIAKAATAASALAEAGLDDLAELAMEAVPPLSPLEAEIVRFIES